MTANSVFDFYIDAQVMLLIAALVWTVTSALLGMSALRNAFPFKLKLIYGLLGAIAVVPLALLALGAVHDLGLIGNAYAVSLSDLALAHYLSGQFDMSPTRFESLLTLRSTFTGNVVGLETTLGQIVAVGLALGTIVFLASALRNALRVKRLIGHSHLLRRIGDVQLCVTDQTAIPFSTRGIRRHYIVLPSALLPHADDLSIAVAHEVQHMRQRDLDWEIALEFLRPLFFWNPGFWILKRDVEKLRELACDQQVLGRGGCSVKDYCDCLLRVCQNSLAARSPQTCLVPTVPFVKCDTRGFGRGSAAFLTYRIASMFEKSRDAPSRLATLALMLPVLLTVTVGALAIRGDSDWSQDRLMLSSIVNLERLNQRNSIGQ